MVLNSWLVINLIDQLSRRSYSNYLYSWVQSFHNAVLIFIFSRRLVISGIADLSFTLYKKLWGKFNNLDFTGKNTRIFNLTLFTIIYQCNEDMGYWVQLDEWCTPIPVSHQRLLSSSQNRHKNKCCIPVYFDQFSHLLALVRYGTKC